MTPRDIQDAVAYFREKVKRMTSAESLDILSLYLTWELVTISRRSPSFTMGHLQNLIERVTHETDKARVPGGEAVGVVAAQSIGQPLTQVMLNSIHAGGGHKIQANMGLTRLDEILEHIVMKTPMMTILTKQIGEEADGTPLFYTPTPREVQSLVGVALNTICKEIYITKDPMTSSPPFTTKSRDVGVVALASKTFGPECMAKPELPEDRPSDYILRLELDREVCVSKGVTPSMVAKVVRAILNQSKTQATIVFSPSYTDLWVIRVRVWGDESTGTYLAAESTKDLVVNKVVIGGVGTVTQASLDTSPFVVELKDGSLATIQRPTVTTMGSCLRAIAHLSWIDWGGSTTNDVVEARNVLGHGAARAVLTEQLHAVLFSQGGYIDPRHIALLVDTILMRGSFMTKINRYGLILTEAGPLQKSTFEWQFKVLMEAAGLGLTDDMDGPSQAVMMGAKGPYGTGSFGLLVPQSMQPKQPRRYATDKFSHLVTTTMRKRYDAEARRLGVPTVQTIENLRAQTPLQSHGSRQVSASARDLPHPKYRLPLERLMKGAKPVLDMSFTGIVEPRPLPLSRPPLKKDQAQAFRPSTPPLE